MKICVVGSDEARRDRIAEIVVESGHDGVALSPDEATPGGCTLAILDLATGNEPDEPVGLAARVREAVARCRAQLDDVDRERSPAPVLVIGPEPDPDTLNAAIEAGADDYLCVSPHAFPDMDALRRRLAIIEGRIARIARERPPPDRPATAGTPPRGSKAGIRRLPASERRKRRALDRLGRVQRALAGELDLPALLRTAVEGVQESFGYPLVSVYLNEDGVLRLQHQVGYPRTIERIPLDRGVAGRVARTGGPVLLADGSRDPDFLRAFDAVASEVCVPLKVGGRVVGIFNVESTVVGALGRTTSG